MTREQIQDFLAMTQAAYPNFNPPSKMAAVNAWTLALEDYEEKQVHMAFKLYMQTNTSSFAPVPRQIIDKINAMTQPRELNEMEAWSLVSKAIQNSGYSSVEEFEKLPPIVQKAVGLPSQLRTLEDKCYGKIFRKKGKTEKSRCFGFKNQTRSR